MCNPTISFGSICYTCHREAPTTRAQLLTRNVNRKTVQKKPNVFGASLKNRCLKYLNEVQVQASVINRQRKTPPIYIRTNALILHLVLEQSCKYLSIVRNSVIHAEFLFNLAL